MVVVGFVVVEEEEDDDFADAANFFGLAAMVRKTG